MKEEDIEKYIKFVDKLISLHLISKQRRVQVEKMLSKIGSDYFSAPASSKKSFHYAFPGGLVKHSINVYLNLVKLNDAFDMNFSKESMLICSLFHDIGKAVNSDFNPHYVPVEDDWRIEKYGQMYDKDDGSVYLPNHQRSLFVLHKFRVPLSAEEYQAILLNDGQYIEENRGYKMKESKLALFLHLADRIACEKEKEEQEK